MNAASAWAGWLPPLVVVVPLAVAALLLMTSHLLPRPVPDVAALVTTLAAVAASVFMAGRSMQHPLVYWFGGWVPRAGLPPGIGFVVEPVGATLAAFIATLFAAALVFAWGYYDEVHAHFHVLMLLFMAAMIGFCVTHDLFNMFVWFEVMSVAAFALTGYRLRTAALEGALNFTVVNTIGAYLFLAGLGLLYARLGALDFSALARGVAKQPHDVVIRASFVLLATGLLVKAAQVPFHFWLADAHSVAPSPVSVIFSGAMVALGLYGVAKLLWAVFMPSHDVQRLVHVLLLGSGAASALTGGVLALLQRHIKRMLAFSTMSHVGLLLLGLALLDRDALSGVLLYLVGHGLTKAALFMIAGILLALCGGIDEYRLRGRARHLPLTGLVMAAAGLLIAGLPFGLTGAGADAIEAASRHAGLAWIPLVMSVAGALTGAAILRAAGRVFLGMGEPPGVNEEAPTEDDVEKADRPLWLMLTPALLLLALSLAGARWQLFDADALQAFVHPDDPWLLGLAGPGRHAAPALTTTSAQAHGWLSALAALTMAYLSLTDRALPRRVGGAFLRPLRPLLSALQSLHNGGIGDYVAWQSVGLAAVATLAAVL